MYSYKGNVLAHEDGFASRCQQKYGAPFADVHRGDLQRELVRRAEELGVEVVLGARVVGVEVDVPVEEEGEDEDEEKEGEGVNGEGVNGGATRKEGRKRTLAQLKLHDGRIYEVDLLVAADGLWSTCRSIYLGRRDAPLPTGDLAYRIVLPVERIEDEELKRMVTEPGVRFWIGPDAHVVAYSLRGGSLYNVVLLVPDDLGEGVSRVEGGVEEMRGLFEGWDERSVLPLSSSCHQLSC